MRYEPSINLTTLVYTNKNMTLPLSTSATIHISRCPALDPFAPEVLFGHFASQTHSIFLDSSRHTEQARYSILLWQPVLSVISQQQVTNVVVHAAQWQSFVAAYHNRSLNPLAQVQRLHEAIFGQKEGLSNLDLPFKVGFAGHFGYDLGIYIEAFEDYQVGEYQTPDMSCHLYLHSLIYDHQTQQYTLCTYGEDRQHRALQATLLDLVQTALPSTAFTLTDTWQANMSESEYTQSIAKIHDYILAGDCYQTNFAQRFDNAYEGDEYQYYIALRAKNLAPFSCFVRTEQGAILSLSPERFIQARHGRVETKPIKGTMPRSADPVKDQDFANALLSSEKDRAENLMIVDLLRNDLSKHCQAGSIEVPKLFALETYPAVHHLVSTVTGTLAHPQDIYALLAGAFPGGSITGAPKIRAMQIIQELEPNGRNIYCGSIGYIGMDYDMDTNICIRTVLCENNRVYCWAGGGIVLDSEARAEYAETKHKISKIIPLTD